MPDFLGHQQAWSIPGKKIDCYENVSPPKSTDKEMFSSQFKSWCRKFAGFFTWMIVFFARWSGLWSRVIEWLILLRSTTTRRVWEMLLQLRACPGVTSFWPPRSLAAYEVEKLSWITKTQVGFAWHERLIDSLLLLSGMIKRHIEAICDPAFDTAHKGYVV